MNVSSVVVHANSEYIDDLIELFEKSDFCDYHFCEKERGVIVLTLEGEGIEQEMAKFKQIEKTEHVISAQMMMSYSEDELDNERANIEVASSVPEILNDDSIPIEKTPYSGSLKGKL